MRNDCLVDIYIGYIYNVCVGDTYSVHIGGYTAQFMLNSLCKKEPPPINPMAGLKVLACCLFRSYVN